MPSDELDEKSTLEIRCLMPDVCFSDCVQRVAASLAFCIKIEMWMLGWMLRWKLRRVTRAP